MPPPGSASEIRQPLSGKEAYDAVDGNERTVMADVGTTLAPYYFCGTDKHRHDPALREPPCQVLHDLVIVGVRGRMNERYSHHAVRTADQSVHVCCADVAGAAGVGHVIGDERWQSGG